MSGVQSSDLTAEFLLIGPYRPCALPRQTPQESYRGYCQSYFTDGETEAHGESTLSEVIRNEVETGFDPKDFGSQAPSQGSYKRNDFTK